MRCNEIVIELDAYLTGELDAAITTEIEQHLQRCSACRVELRHLQKENQLYRAYSSTVEVPAEAWSQIQMRTAHMKTSNQQRPETRPGRFRGGSRFRLAEWRLWAAAASLLLAIGLSFYLSRSDTTSSPGGPDTGGPGLQTNPQIDAAVQDLQTALGLLQATYDETKRNLDPRLVTELDRNLGMIRAAIEECKQALQQQPDSDQATQFLLLNYEKEINTLRQITEAL